MLVVFEIRHFCFGVRGREGEGGSRTTTYGIVNDILGARIVVNVNGDAAQGRDLGRQLVEARVVLALAFVGFGHVVGRRLFTGCDVLNVC